MGIIAKVQLSGQPLDWLEKRIYHKCQRDNQRLEQGTKRHRNNQNNQTLEIQLIFNDRLTFSFICSLTLKQTLHSYIVLTTVNNQSCKRFPINPVFQTTI
uniref:Uncharacterized protein n=1 Tax=Micrurus lemniscatus lemniscatus TaxID=129467 RepID=A0A2D4JQ83_MICLE